jgi:hypothetical protein
MKIAVCDLLNICQPTAPSAQPKAIQRFAGYLPVEGLMAADISIFR